MGVVWSFFGIEQLIGLSAEGLHCFYI